MNFAYFLGIDDSIGLFELGIVVTLSVGSFRSKAVLVIIHYFKVLYKFLNIMVYVAFEHLR